jgi:hypothetical protein
MPRGAKPSSLISHLLSPRKRRGLLHRILLFGGT